jgi:hypothetical protein
MIVDPNDVQIDDALNFDEEDNRMHQMMDEVEDISKDMVQQQVMAVAPAGEDDDDEDLLEQQLMQQLQ